MASEPGNGLQQLFHDTLKDIYYAERKILGALPKMAKAAQAKELKAAFEKHETETQVQIERLEQVFEIIGHPARGKKCDAIEGTKAKRSCRSTKALRPSTRVCSQLRRRSSITKSRATAR